jgi:hypothetical protein
MLEKTLTDRLGKLLLLHVTQLADSESWEALSKNHPRSVLPPDGMENLAHPVASFASLHEHGALRSSQTTTGPELDERMARLSQVGITEHRILSRRDGGFCRVGFYAVLPYPKVTSGPARPLDQGRT